MTLLRRHIHRCHWLPLALIVTALLIKMLVPMGYMPSLADGVFAIQPCVSQSAEVPVMTAGDHTHVAHHDNHTEGGEYSAFHAPCAFSGLAIPGLAAADPILLAIAIFFIIANAFRITPTLIMWRSVRLRPPSQGPPATL